MEVVKYCEYCGKPMTEREVKDFRTLCERCYHSEYYFNDYID